MRTPVPWTAESGPPTAEPRRHAPATLRNRDAIRAVLDEELPTSGTVLEIASGSGEHALYFAAAWPALTWQPSDHDPVARASIAAHAGDYALANLLPPIELDASSDGWPITDAAAILCINMLHISPWTATEGLFAGAARLLSAGAPLIVYGPFIEADVPTAPSNCDFDASLRARDAAWGLRNVGHVDALAARYGFVRTRRIAMPANNLTLVWRKPR